MTLLDLLIRSGGIPTAILVLIGLVALLIGVVTGVLFAMKKRVPPAVFLVPLAGCAVVAAFAYLSGLSGLVSALAHAPPEMRASLMYQQLSSVIATGFASSVVLVVAAQPGVWLCMVIGFRQTKRSWGTGLGAAAILIACALLPFLGLIVDGEPVYMLLRSVSIALLILPASLVLVSTDEPGRVAGAFVASALACVVIGGVAMESSLNTFDASRALAFAVPNQRGMMLKSALDVAGTQHWLNAIPIALSLGLAMFAAARVKVAKHRLGVTVGLCAVGLCLLLWLLPASSIQGLVLG
ncbi:MAG: hypothetical protein AB8H79_26415 [Myxococcota bacterium]